MAYTVFISHGWHDRWIAARMADQIVKAGGSPFIDIFDIKKGDRIEECVQRGLREAVELVAFLTPHSVGRNWVWSEISAAWILGKRTVGVLYGVTIDEIEQNHGGMATLRSTNVIAIDDFDAYIEELADRIDAETGR